MLTGDKLLLESVGEGSCGEGFAVETETVLIDGEIAVVDDRVCVVFVDGARETTLVVGETVAERLEVEIVVEEDGGRAEDIDVDDCTAAVELLSREGWTSNGDLGVAAADASC